MLVSGSPDYHTIAVGRYLEDEVPNVLGVFLFDGTLDDFHLLLRAQLVGAGHYRTD